MSDFKYAPHWMTPHLRVIREWFEDAQRSFTEGDANRPEWLDDEVGFAVKELCEALPDPVGVMQERIDLLKSEVPADVYESIEAAWQELRTLRLHRDSAP